MDNTPSNFDKTTWDQLPDFLDQLPEPVQLNIWCDPEASPAEAEGVKLAQTLNEQFQNIDFIQLPRRINFHYYPVFGVMGVGEEEAIDFGVRIIGLPTGYQMTSLIAGIQCVSFRGMTSEARSRITLQKLKQDVSVEVISSAEDEGGAIMAQTAFNMAVASPKLRSYLIMGDQFSDALLRYSVSYLPHTVIDGRVHIDGVVDEKELLEQIAKAIEPAG